MESPAPQALGRVFDIQRFSIHDGPGIRTTVFLKGCPLACRWCHNPEGISPDIQLSFLPERCVGCGACLKACPRAAHLMEAGIHRLDRTRCRACGACAASCPAEALAIVGRDMTVRDVLREVLEDKPFYETSGGGLTVSGGEPMRQADFTEALLAEARASGLHTCLETSGFADGDRIRRLLPLVDLFLYDVKHTDAALHRAATGVPNGPILRNLRALHDAGARIRIRVPFIPGANDGEGNLEGLRALVRSLPRLDGVDLMPYHRLGAGKRARLGLSELPEHALPDGNEVARWREALRPGR